MSPVSGRLAALFLDPAPGPAGRGPASGPAGRGRRERVRRVTPPPASSAPAIEPSAATPRDTRAARAAPPAATAAAGPRRIIHVAPAAPAAAEPAMRPLGRSVAPAVGTPPYRGRRGRGRRRLPTTGEPVLAAAVLGDGSAPALAADLAALLARRARLPVPVTAIWRPAEAAAPPAGATSGRSAAHAARTVAAALEGAGVVAVATGSAVQVALPADGAAAATTMQAVAGTVAGHAVVVVAVCGPRPAALDGLLAGQDLLVAVVDGGAPPLLRDLSRTSLAAAAPRASIVTVVRPGGALPGPLRHRAALRHILEVLDARP